MGELDGIYQFARPNKNSSSPKDLLDPVLSKFQLRLTRVATIFRPLGFPFYLKNQLGSTTVALDLL